MPLDSQIKISRRGHEYGVVHLESPENGNLKDIVIKYIEMDEARFLELLWLGSIYLKGQRVIEDQALKAGDYLRVHTNPRRYPIDVVKYPDLIILETKDFVVIHKPSGLPVHAGVDNLHENTLAILNKEMNLNLRITNRLDVATEGLLLYAKTPSYQAQFNEYLTQRKVKKIYRALVHSHSSIPLGTVVHYMEPSPRAPKNVKSEKQEGWQECILEITEVNSIDSETKEVFIHLITGRTHQIRAQLSAMGCPIVGDYQYGSHLRLSENLEIIKLQCYSPQFPDNLSVSLTTSPLFTK